MAESRPIALPTALLVATAAVACTVAAACAYLLLALVVVEGHGAVALQEDAWAAWCGAAACACGTVAALIALTRGAGIRPLALLVAWALAFAWPLTGAPPAAAAVATVATGFVVRWGADGHARRADTPAAGALAALSILLLAAAFGGAPAAVPANEARAGGAPAAAPADEQSADDAPSAPPADEARDDDSPAAAPADETRADDSPAAAAIDETRADDSPADAPSTKRAPTTHPPTHPIDETRADDAPAAAPADETNAGGAVAPADVVRAYYRALDRRDFAAAWRVLSPRSARTSAASTAGAPGSPPRCRAGPQA